MKKLISAVLALTLAISLTACGGSGSKETTAPVVQETTAPAEAAGSALEILETTWNAYGEDEKFAVIGGSMAAPVDGAPGSFDLADENITFNLLIPADQLANVTEAASMIHMMNANTFTGAAYRLAEGVAPGDFAAAMKETIMNNQWICGFPEELTITAIGGEFVVIAFGAMDLMNVFTTHLTAAYPTAESLVSETLI